MLVIWLIVAIIARLSGQSWGYSILIGFVVGLIGGIGLVVYDAKQKENKLKNLNQSEADIIAASICEAKKEIEALPEKPTTENPFSNSEKDALRATINKATVILAKSNYKLYAFNCKAIKQL